MVHAVGHACKENPLATKWILARSRRAVGTVLELAAQAGFALFDVHIKTPNEMIRELTDSWLMQTNQQRLEMSAGPLLMHRLFLDLKINEKLTYLADQKISPALCRLLYRSISDLREAGITPAQLRQQSQTDRAEKSADLALLLQHYEEFLSQNCLVDRVQLQQQAIKQLSSTKKQSPYPSQEIIILRGLDDDLPPRELEFVKQLPQNQIRWIFEKDDKLRPPSCPRDRLRFFARPDEIPTNTNPQNNPNVEHWANQHIDGPYLKFDQGQNVGTVRFAQCVGETNEVRQIFRFLHTHQIPLDHVEIVHSDAQTYVPLLWEQIQTIARDTIDLASDTNAKSPSPNFEATFADGLPVSLSKPARALRLWVDWVDHGYPQHELEALLAEDFLSLEKTLDDAEIDFLNRLTREGDLADVSSFFSNDSAIDSTDGKLFDDGNADPAPNKNSTITLDSSSPLARYLSSITIGKGVERYQQILEKEVEKTQTSPDWQTTPDDDRRQLIQHQLAQILYKVVQPLLALSRDWNDDPNPDDWLTGAELFVRNWAAGTGKLANFARGALADALAGQRLVLEQVGDDGFDASVWLRSLPRQLVVLGEGPRAGRLHLAPLDQAGWSQRPYTFMIGMDDARLAAGGQQDPLVLDHERQVLSDQLSTVSDRVQRRRLQLQRFFHRVAGHVILTYPSQDAADGRPKFPSHLLVQAFRAVTGQLQITPSILATMLPPPISLAPQVHMKSAQLDELRLTQLLSSTQSADSNHRVSRWFSNLAFGAQSAQARQSDRITAYDGFVPLAGLFLDPTQTGAEALSSGRLEQLGRCPLAYFFRRGLQLVAPSDPLSDPKRRVKPPQPTEEKLWLDGSMLGTILHDVFEEFMSKLAEKNQRPDPLKHAEELTQRLDRHLHRYRDKVPSPSEAVYEADVKRAHQTALQFLVAESQHCQEHGSYPRFLESTFGMDPGKHSTPLDDPAPQPLQLPSGRQIPVCGRVDRIDFLPNADPPGYVIWDYKTGSAKRYTENRPFNQGRVVQPVLYLLMVQQHLQKADPPAPLHSFGFIFVRPDQFGDRQSWSRDEIPDGLQILDDLIQNAQEGYFLPTENHKDDCHYCDYRTICQDVETQADSVKSKLVNIDDPHHPQLEPRRRLRKVRP